MIRNQGVPDRLYLSQGEENIYITNYKLPAHHINGLRFLFRQYKMKNLGVIINDEFGYGRTLQIVLFLKAIISLINKPILIMCAEGSVNQWTERFFTWTNFDDEVTIGSTAAIIKKPITINPMLNLPAYASHEWSIVIVESDNNSAADQVLKLNFNADFKIWSTSVNMKKNLDKFSEIYSWLYPNDIFDIYYYIPDEEDCVDVIEKSILLDSFMEDIVIRRDDLSESFENYLKDCLLPSSNPDTEEKQITETVSKINDTTTKITETASKKNKDATGTKIKRTKTKTDVNVTGEMSKTNATNVPEKVSAPVVTNEALAAALFLLLGDKSKTDDASVENTKEKDDEGKESRSNVININYSESQTDLQSDHAESQFAGNEPTIMDTPMCGKDTLQSKEQIDQENTEAFYTSSSSSNDQNKVLKCDELKDKPKISKHIHLSENERNLDEIPLPPKKSKTDLKNIKTTQNVDELNEEIGDLSQEDDISLKLREIFKTSDADVAIVASKQNTDNFNFIDDNLSALDDNDEINVSPVKLSKQSGGSGTKPNEMTSLKRNTDNIDDKMKECEKKVTKKFKGSFLDRLL